MAYLLGLDALLAILGGEPDHPIKRWSRTVDSADLFVSVMTVGEVEAALQALPPTEIAKREQYRNLLDVHVPRVFGHRALDVTLSLAREWGRVTQEARALGVEVKAEEAIEIATARVNGYTYVATAEPYHLKMGLTVLDPASQ